MHDIRGTSHLFRLVSLLPSVAALSLALLPSTAHAAPHTGTQQEERLIGWLGEVPRPNSLVDTDAVNRNSAMDNDEAGVPGGAELARYPDHDASGLNTDFIGVGNPRVEKLSDEPRAYLYHGFLSPEEAAHLIKIGEPHLKRSTVVGGKKDTGEDNGLTDDVRTSHGTFIPKEYDDIVYSVEKRVEQFSQISYENQEQLQLLRYFVGQQYKDHMDGLFSENGGKRIATVLMFLHEPDKGGETSFPHGKPLPYVKERLRGMKDTLSDCAWRDGRGLSVRPKVGDAVLFFSFDRKGNSDQGSMHASCPTLGGVKWTATKWIHERQFQTGVWKTPKCEDSHTECQGWAASGVRGGTLGEDCSNSNPHPSSSVHACVHSCFSIHFQHTYSTCIVLPLSYIITFFVFFFLPPVSA